MFIIITDLNNKVLFSTTKLNFEECDFVVDETARLYIEETEPVFTSINGKMYFLNGKMFLEHELN